MYWCHYSSGKFEFNAFGSTPEAAKLTFKRGIIKHTNQTHASVLWAAAVIEETEPVAIELDTFYRDGTTL